MYQSFNTLLSATICNNQRRKHSRLYSEDSKMGLLDLNPKVLYKSIECGLNHDLHPLKTYNGSQEYFKHQERNVCAKIF